MAQKHRSHNSNRRGGPRAANADIRTLRQLPQPIERRPPVVYGKPFILLEDDQKNTFIYKAGAWVPHDVSIAQCQEHCQVKKLAQPVNKMTRYEVRCPEGAE